jgi:cell division transport system ATP-binding protein
MSQAPAVTLNNVSLRYEEGPDVLTSLNLTLQQGAFHFLTGPSGAGKTSLLKLLYLDQRPTNGVVHLFGTNVTAAARGELPAIRRKVGVVFQEFRLLDHLSTFDNVALPLRVAGLSEPEIKSNVTELLSCQGGRSNASRSPGLSSTALV